MSRASRNRYEIAPEELFRLMREIRAAGLEFLGIYHSHPNGKNEPSPRDIERAYYPEAAYFILSPLPDTVRPVRAFRFAMGTQPNWRLRIGRSPADGSGAMPGSGPRAPARPVSG